VTEPPRPLLVLLIDAYRHDYLGRGETPAIDELAAGGHARPLQTILGYSDSIRATAFTGLHPDELGYWMEYRFAPGHTPFRPFTELAPLDRVPSDLALRALKLGLSRTVVPAIARRRGYTSLDLRHLPFGAMRFFAYTLRGPMTSYAALPAPTIFDRLTETGRSWTYLDSSKVGDEGIDAGIAASPARTSLLFVYLHHVDMASHLFGIEGKRFRSTLRATDERVARIVGAARQRLGDLDVLLFSDHGMSPATTFRSLPELRRHPAFAKAFVYALDATMVRLWFRHDAGPSIRDEIRELVARDLPTGRFLDDAERTWFHVAFPHRDYGDEIYLIPPGEVIFPNFHSYIRPKAMHAYDPGDPDQQGIVVVAGDRAPALAERVEMVDVHGMIERLTGLEPARPVAGVAAGSR
jgi:predicted AlkP superfamily pyrophosphatase or phosphodiesterase